MAAIEFPPLLSGHAVAGDAFAMACAAADQADPGTVFYSPDEATMRAALTLAPETPLSEAIGVSFAASLGLNDALGSLAPPEVAVHLAWPDRFRVNGALCGRLLARASTLDVSAVPDWLVIGVEMPLTSQSTGEPGQTPEDTCLHAEGCGAITAPDLIEAWARHMMNWLHIYLTDGFAELHEDWRAKAWGLGEDIQSPEPGEFIGLDEQGGIILKTKNCTRIFPLTDMLIS